MTIEDQEGWGDMMEEVEGDFGKYLDRITVIREVVHTLVTRDW